MFATADVKKPHSLVNKYMNSLIEHSRLTKDLPKEALRNPICLKKLDKEGQTGDIILFRGQGALSESIEAVTKGPYSHAIVLIRGSFKGTGKNEGHTYGQDGVLQIFQSTGAGEGYDQYVDGKLTSRNGGVILSPFKTLYPTYLSMWGEVGCWQRLQVPDGKRAEVDRLMKEFAGEVINHDYDGGIVHMSLKSVLKGIFDIDDHKIIRDKYYCSSLVAAALEYSHAVKESNVLSYTPASLGNWTEMNEENMEEGFAFDAPRLVQVWLVGPHSFRTINIYEKSDNHKPDVIPSDDDTYVYPSMSDLEFACTMSSEVYKPYSGFVRSPQISVQGEDSVNVWNMVTASVGECKDNKYAGVWKCATASKYNFVFAFRGSADARDFVEDLEIPGYGVKQIMEGIKGASGHDVKENELALTDPEYWHELHAASNQRMRGALTGNARPRDMESFKIPPVKGMSWEKRSTWSVDALKAAMEQYPDAKWLVTGHSLGGTLALHATRGLPAKMQEKIHMCIAINPVVTTEIYKGINKLDTKCVVMHATCDFAAQSYHSLRTEFARRALEVLVHADFDHSVNIMKGVQKGHSADTISAVLLDNMDSSNAAMEEASG